MVVWNFLELRLYPNAFGVGESLLAYILCNCVETEPVNVQLLESVIAWMDSTRKGRTPLGLYSDYCSR